MSAILAVLVGGVLLVPGVPTVAAADPSPSAHDVAESARKAHERAAAVGRIKGRLARAEAGLDNLATRAEVAIERYNGEMVRLGQARRTYAEARGRLAAAQRRYDATRSEMAVFAANAYRANMMYGSWRSVVGADGGPQGFLDRAGMVQVMARREAGMVDRVRAAKIIGEMYRRRADMALRDQQTAAQRAGQARRTAQDAVARQRAAVRVIEAAKARLVRQLARAEARTARLRRARAASAGRADGAVAVPLAGLAGTSRRGGLVAAAALRWLGTPYSWGGGTASGPSYGVAQGAGIRGFDCSGLALYAWAKAGVRLDHWTGTQWTSGPHVPTSELRPGDLVFFATDTGDPSTIHHVGIFIGRGRMVEAPYTGARVRISSIWRGDLIGATRPT
jgi:cell wall-associated NlpC family hydrolase